MSRPREKNKHLPKYVTVRHGSYWYQPPESKAVRIAAVGDERTLYTYLANAQPAVGPLVTMGDCLDRYMREVVPTMRERTQHDYQRHIEKLKAVFGAELPQNIKPKDIGRYLDVPKGKIHRNKLVGILSAVFNKAIGRWYVEGVTANPCSGVERNPSRQRDRYITDAEYELVYAAMPPRVQIGMDLALLTGQRQGDLLNLQWKDVSNDGVYFQQGKTGKKLLVEISPALHAVLARAKHMLPQLPRQYVIRSRKGLQYRAEGFRAIWQRRIRKLHQSGKLPVRFTFHDIRAKTVSDSESLEAAMERAGHTSMAMTRGVYDRGIRKVTPLK